MLAKQNVDQFIDNLIKTEGGYTNHPSDPGKATCWGWTEKNARARGYKGHICDLPVKMAKQWYYEDYWLEPGFNLIYTENAYIAEELFDSGVNVGERVAIGWLQRSLNALNRQGRDYKDIAVDGLVGNETTTALRLYLEFRGKNGVTVLMRCLNGLQTAYYMSISNINEDLEDFTFGWVLNRVIM